MKENKLNKIIQVDAPKFRIIKGQLISLLNCMGLPKSNLLIFLLILFLMVVDYMLREIHSL